MRSPTGFSTMSSAIEFANNYNLWILNIFRPYLNNNLLEIGTGQGNFKNYLPSLKSYVSVDVDCQVIERAIQRDPSGHYLVADISSDKFREQIKKNYIDTILCVNVLEHIADDRKAILNMMSVLQPGGRLLLFVPAFQSLYSDMDRLAGHFRRYSKGDITLLFKDNSFQIEKLEYFNPVGGIGWWINKFFKHEELDSKSINSQIYFFDKYIVPISQILNKTTKDFFGQSLICVVKKKNS